MPYSDKNEQKRYQREWLTRRGNDWIATQGGKCAACGSTDRLEIDHIDPAKKECNPTHLWSLNRETRDVELAKCQVLCHDCHAAKTYAPRPIVHGTCAGYQKHRCRCDLCRGWNRDRQCRQRARRYADSAPVTRAA
jgi:hypothetical protein